MKLTKNAQLLKDIVDKHGKNYEDRPQEIEELATCAGSEGIDYALFEGGYLIPNNWVEGDDLVKLEESIKMVSKFRDIISSLHDEI